jgi:type I restriction enzyme S subunit
MTALPHGWREVALSDVAQVSGGIQKQQKRRPVTNKHPFLRVANVARGALVLDDVHEIELFPGEIDRYRLQEGDLLVVEGNGSVDQIGRAAVWNGSIEDCVHQNHLIRVRPHPEILPQYLGLVWNAPVVSRRIQAVAATTSGLHTLSTAKVKAVRIPICSLEEQWRIVDILEDHLSRLDAARDYLAASKRRLAVAHRAILSQIIPEVASYPPDWETSTVGDAGLVELGRQRHPDWHTGENMRPYLRVANVFEDEMRTDDLKEMHWPGETFERFKVHPGDILMNEGQTPDLLGRPALYRGDPAEVAFTNSLIRFRAKTGVLPEFALLVFRRHMHAKRFKRESRITTNIAHLSAARVKTIEFPIPSLDEQRRLVAQADALLSANRRVREGILQAGARGEALRHAVLSAAFAGQLTGRPNDLDRVEELATAGVSV